MKIKVMTFNIEHCWHHQSQAHDFDAFAGVIRDSGADIVGLNEVRDLGEDPAEFGAQAKELADRLGFYWYFAKAFDVEGANPYGNALLSRYPIRSAEVIPVPDPAVPAYDGYYETRCLLRACVEVAGGLELRVIHFGLNPDEQQNAVNTVVPQLDSDRLVLMGDMNVTPDDPVLDPIRARVNDTASLISGCNYTFASYEPDRKIDYIFVGNGVKPLSCTIPQIVCSDHFPMVAEIEL